MAKQRKYGRMGGTAASVSLAALVLAAIPTTGFALDALEVTPRGLVSNVTAFTPASVDPRVAALVARTDAGKRMIRFTPAGMAERENRSVTVAVRVDEDAAQAIQVRSAIAAAKEQVAASNPAALRIAPMRYNLGVSRGFESFAQPSVINRKLSDAEIPDLATFRPSPGAKDKPSRFTTRIELEQEATAGSSPRTKDALGSQSVDVGGSYRLTKNLDVTAGVRYQQERDRLAPLADPTTQDSQAVYVGTQFRF